MDNETSEPPRIDPPVGVSRITVEAAPVAVEANWSPGRASARRTAVPGRPCPHRVRFRDLKASRKGLFVSVASLAFGALALALLGLFTAIGLAIVAVVEPDPTALIAAAVVAVPSALLVIGIVACSRTWRRLHRPGLPVCVLTTIALLPITVGVAYVAATGSLWAAILLVPPLVPVVALWYFRSALYDRATCARYPWFPPQVVAMLKLDPGPAAEYARAKASAFRIEDCPHVVRFRDLRTRHRVYGLGFSFLYFLYLLGFFAMCIVVLAIMVGSLHTGPAVTAATAAGAAVFIPLTAVGLKEYSARAKRLHRAVTGVYTLAFIGFVGFAGLAVWVAVILDDPLFYGIAALTVVPVLSARSAAKTLTKRSECRTHPELPPEIQALMKG